VQNRASVVTASLMWPTEVTAEAPSKSDVHWKCGTRMVIHKLLNNCAIL